MNEIHIQDKICKITQAKKKEGKLKYLVTPQALSKRRLNLNP